MSIVRNLLCIDRLKGSGGSHNECVMAFTILALASSVQCDTWAMANVHSVHFLRYRCYYDTSTFTLLVNSWAFAIRNSCLSKIVFVLFHIKIKAADHNSQTLVASTDDRCLSISKLASSKPARGVSSTYSLSRSTCYRRRNFYVISPLATVRV